MWPEARCFSHLLYFLILLRHHHHRCQSSDDSIIIIVSSSAGMVQQDPLRVLLILFWIGVINVALCYGCSEASQIEEVRSFIGPSNHLIQKHTVISKLR
ncbi:hypothetical protein Tco_1302513 [Tanacetum coccineum]